MWNKSQRKYTSEQWNDTVYVNKVEAVSVRGQWNGNKESYSMAKKEKEEIDVGACKKGIWTDTNGNSSVVAILWGSS